MKQLFSSKVVEAEKELAGNSSDVKAARKVLGLEQGAISNINEMHFYKAVNRILAYRILDVCQWIKGGGPSMPTMAAVPNLAIKHNDLLKKLVRTNAITHRC
jgi:hypothetical protein